MRNDWSEDGDTLVLKSRGTPIGWVIVATAMIGVSFYITFAGLIGVLGNLMLWFMVGLGLLSSVERVECDRRAGIMRQRDAFGRQWTTPLKEFAGVHVLRARSGRGNRQIRVNLQIRERLGEAWSPECVVAVYWSPDAADEQNARKWGDRLAKFLDLPVRIDL
jgi:hypothetical protein